MQPLLEPNELEALGPTARLAAERFSLTQVGQGDAELFTLAFGYLAGEFGPRGELERREVLAGWVQGEPSYALVVARDRDGNIAGVRDCHVRVVGELVVVYLAHLLVLPRYRRSGLGRLLREATIALARRRAGTRSRLVLAAEMEPYAAGNEASAIRLVAYGKSGFAVVDPAACRYYQPDFAAGRDDPMQPVPLLLLVRAVDDEGRRSLPADMVRGVVGALYDVFASHCPPSPLFVLEQGILSRLSANVALLAIPQRIDAPELAALVHADG